jgi:hypothetical protein
MAAVKNPETGLYDVEIEGQQYSFQKWGADSATDALLDLSGIVAKPLGAGVGALFGKKKDEDDGEAGKPKTSAENIGLIMEALLDRVSANKATCKALLKKFASENVLCDGKKISFDSHYADRMPHMFKVVQAAVEVQFGNFFGEFLGSVGIKMPKTGGITNRAPTT